MLRPDSLKFNIHGLAAEISSDLHRYDEALSQTLWPFESDTLPEGIPHTTGFLRSYDAHEVNRHLSATAVPLSLPGQPLELYQEGERYWLVDDRWGLCELNLLRSTFRSWILPQPTLDPFRMIEAAVLWPLAQLLRPKGLWLVPAASVSRCDHGILIICPFNLESELRALIRAGYSIVGQRWTALRDDQGRIELLQMPGHVEREASPRLRDTGGGPASRYVDLTSEFCGVVQNQAFCDTVLVVEPGRRNRACVTQIAAQRAADTIKKAWPITELHPFRKHGQLPLRLGQLNRCMSMQLSREPGDLLVMLDSIHSPAGAASITLASAALSSPPALRQAM